MSDKRVSIEYRAAEHFGWQDRPRSTFRTGRWAVLIFSQGQLGIYSEEVGTDGPSGLMVALTDEHRSQLSRALERPNSDALA